MDKKKNQEKQNQEKIKRAFMEDPFDYTEKKMVGWYDARQLLNTAVQTLISSVFGSYSDKRELQACLAKDEVFDYSTRPDVWIDYMADTGDGFHSTFTMANLLSEEERVVNGHETYKGDILILGGDQVYPVANREDYKNRLRGPFDSACRNQNERRKYNGNQVDKEHDLFAIPGNHDWYDGLSNFIKIFCQGRTIGNWLTRQHRSYFAIKLPHNWWIWGIDIQLEADIDFPQLQYFDKIAAKRMLPGDKVILCTAEPCWVFTTRKHDKSYSNLKFFEQRYIIQNGFELALTISGDLHHYARYTYAENGKTFHKLTSGGGGAFLHPTHHLPEMLNLREGSFKLQNTFPSKKVSHNLTYWNVAFPWFNLQFACFMGVFYLLFAWLLQEATKNNMHTFMFEVSEYPLILPEVTHYLTYLFNLLIINPFMVFFISMVIFCVAKFTDTKSSNARFLWLFGMVHGCIHILNGFLLIWVFSRFAYHLDINLLLKILVLTILLFVVGGLTGCVVMGSYLLITNFLYGIHGNEAFSAIKWTGYKNFLRLHITAEALIIYPIGVEKTAKWQKKGKVYIPNREVETKLVDQIIVIKSKKHEEASPSLSVLTHH